MRNPAKPIEFIICFSDHTWIEDTFLVPYILWLNKDKAEVEDRLRDEIELKYTQKSVNGPHHESI